MILKCTGILCITIKLRIVEAVPRSHKLILIFFQPIGALCVEYGGNYVLSTIIVLILIALVFRSHRYILSEGINIICAICHRLLLFRIKLALKVVLDTNSTENACVSD